MRNPDTSNLSIPDVTNAIRQFRRAIRRNDQIAARAWLDIAARCIRLQTRRDAQFAARHKHEAWLEEQPLRQRILENRVAFPHRG